ncbi:YwiC-like family protein [Symbiobacterium thermophilum]|uniref:YwiC-like protein n=1 Tax=Symbiobacterium thermophilum (strain DSM 24528 / JCM 14929 / IAM 14863 / T) TaxID=292459 RepID=Q67LR5_SYMTH|nr:YwiC-like family protein [Symbiobacterium thermophilum]BAD41381.1 conserved hypothetical protein [Symbiobacterium thermophilum IAM 14863]
MRLRPGPVPLPREHGAWAMVLTPAVVAVLALGPQPLGLVALLGWLTAYAARGPLEVLLGRGASGRAGMASAEPEVAGFWLLALAAAAAALLLPVAALRPAVLGLLAGALLLACLVFWLAQRGRTRSLLSGFLSVTGLMAGAPLYELAGAGGMSLRGWALTYACFAFFAGSIFRVKTMARERKRRSFHDLSVAVHFAFLAAAAYPAVRGWAPPLVPLALVPPLVWSVVCAWRARRRGAARLDRVGWSEVFLTVLFAGLTVLALRLPAWPPPAAHP